MCYGCAVRRFRLPGRFGPYESREEMPYQASYWVAAITFSTINRVVRRRRSLRAQSVISHVSSAVNVLATRLEAHAALVTGTASGDRPMDSA